MSNVTRALGALVGLLILSGVPATSMAESTEFTTFDATTSRSAHLYLSGTDQSKYQEPRKKRFGYKKIKLRYDKPVEVGGKDLVLRFKASLKKKRLLAFEVRF